ncbi:MAG: glycosyltransferase family 4 protein [Methylotenera sp.]|nr:glycosyltransferase family 4 protein [Methylotenera sp.]
MKIFYFATDTFPAWRVDLTELFSRELSQLGMQIDWCLRRDDRGMWTSIQMHGERFFLPPAWPGVPILTPLVRRIGEFLGEILLFFKFIFGERYDIIQVRDDRYTAAFIAWLAARIRGSKFVYWVSFPFPENDFEKAKLTDGVKKIIFQVRGTLTKWWLYKFVLQRADHVFVQSERMRLDISAYGVKLDKMTVVPMGVPTRVVQWRKSVKLEVDRNCVVYLGSMARSRRLELIIHAFSKVLKQCPDAKLYMVGRGDVAEDDRFLMKECEREGLGDSVIFTGFIPMEDAWLLASRAAVCLSPIYPTPIFMQASPTKLNEYLALGRPVIANEHPEQSVTIAASGAGICVKWGAEEFSKAISYLLTHPNEAESMGEKGPAWVAENRSYERIAAAVFDRYRSITCER